MTNLAARLVGVVCLAAAGASTLLHRAIFVAAQSGPAQAAEFAAGLLSFVLASLGVLLLTNGARLFERPAPPAAKPVEVLPVSEPGAGMDESAACDSRYGVARLLSERAIQRASLPQSGSSRVRS
ncbi:hypothetical protein [Sphingomonas desiccabilis]|uniref:Uncharacterized protein n=1 Tax=Sphingomonas desiccabilis TaxID=429134 RepID=A0A4Q2IP50_9SPHN|nr:hypothetical protein [Sphingomonas desiccabilis]MBB3912615.1 hypothetical protein [Sphingomonas desiccabilis]RXZ29900.1 hypothetical protein EO081_16295 [Sphingomonas desiccabilis]